VVELEGRSASLEASPLALGLLGLGAGGRPRRQASRHLVLGMPGLGRWDRPRAHAALATLPTSRPPKHRVTLAFLSLGALRAPRGACYHSHKQTAQAPRDTCFPFSWVHSERYLVLGLPILLI